MKFEARIKGIALTIAAWPSPGPAVAHGFDDCTKEPKDKWKPQAEPRRRQQRPATR